MDSGMQIALTMGLTHGAAILIGLRELWLLRRSSGGGSGSRPPEPAPAPGPLGGGTTPSVPVRKPLPDCLIPKPIGTRVRVLEDA